MKANVRKQWACRALRSPLGDFHGAVVEADNDVLGVAWDESPSSAAVRAIGEAIERTALKIPQWDADYVVGTAAQLRGRAADLSECVRFTKRQLLESPALADWKWTELTPTTWVPMKRPASSSILVPIDLVKMLRVDQTRIRCASSIGTACGPTWDYAVSRAILELIERHVVAESVYSERKAVEIVVDRSSIQHIAERLSHNGLRLRVGLVPNTFGLPVAIAIIQGDGLQTPAAAFGSAASPGIASDALRAAVLEAVHIFHLGWRLMRRGDEVKSVPQGINERVLWWAANGADLVDRYLTGEVLSLADASSALGLSRALIGVDAIGMSLVGAGCEWFFADITPEWATGVKVARVVAPALLQLRLDEELPYLHAPRWPEAISSLVARRDGGFVHPHPYV